MGIEGLNAVLRELEKAQVRHAKGFARGLKKGGLLIQRESQKIVPIEFGVLKNSARTRHEGSGFDTVVYVGYYGVSYAIYVHEVPEEPYMTMKGEIRSGARHDTGKVYKFLERPAREYAPDVSEIIREEIEHDNTV